jgi:hypothetical protein
VLILNLSHATAIMTEAFMFFLCPARHIRLVPQIRLELFPATSFPIIIHYQDTTNQHSMLGTVTRL